MSASPINETKLNSVVYESKIYATKCQYTKIDFYYICHDITIIIVFKKSKLRNLLYQ